MSADGRAGLVGVLALLVVITVATNTASSLAQPQIGEAFDVGPADTGWVVFGYSAMFAVGTALYGGIAGRVGLVPALVSGVLLLTLGSVIAAVAPSMEVLIGSRLVQGIGSGAIPTLSVSLLARSFDGADRARAIGAMVASVGAGLAIGPLLGGVLLETIGWRGAVSIGIASAPAVLVLWRSQRGRADERTGRRLDLIGAGLVAIVALGAAFVLNRTPLLGLIPVTLVPTVAVLAAGLALWERSRTQPDAFLPRAVLDSPVFRRVTVLGAVGMAAFIGTVVLIPPMAARAFGLEGIALGVALLPMAITAAVSSPNNARVEARLGRRRTAAISLLALGLGCLTLAFGALTVGLAAMLVALASIGLGFGLLTAPLLNELTQVFAEAERPVAVGVYNLCFFLGGGLGAAISSALVQAGVELPFFGTNAVPGFATAELLLGLGPMAAAALIGFSGDQRTARADP